MTCNMTFWLCDVTGTNINIVWCQWHVNGPKYISSVRIIKLKCNLTFWVIWCYWCWCQSHDATALSMVPFHFQVKTYKADETWCCGHLMPSVPASTSLDANISSMVPLQLFSQDNQNEVTLVLMLASHDTNGIKNETIAFLRPRQLQWDATCILVVIWCHWHWHQCHIMVTASPMTLLPSLG